MRNPQGHFIITDPDTGVRTIDTFTCFHCNKVVAVPTNKVEDVGDFCRSCMKMICANCAGKGCTPFLKKLERYERRYNLRRSYGVLDV